jgi:hypothetical protein
MDPTLFPLVVAMATLLGVVITGAVTLLGVHITQRRQTEQQRFDREQRERVDRLADARRLRDAKLERLRNLYTTVLRSAQTYHARFTGILVYEAAEKVKATTGRTIRVPGGGTAAFDAEWEQANAAWGSYRASLAVEDDAQDVRAALDGLMGLMGSYIGAIDDGKPRDPIQTNTAANEALSKLEVAVRESLNTIEAQGHE